MLARQCLPYLCTLAIDPTAIIARMIHSKQIITSGDQDCSLADMGIDS
jgi:hypothetical protein